MLGTQAVSIPPKNKNPKLYYGYVIVAICFFIMVTVFGSQMSFGVFFKPMLTEFGWTRAATAGPFSLSVILVGLMGIISGRLSDRFGPRKVITAGAVITGLGYLLMSRTGSLWHFYLFYGVLVAAGTGAIYVPLVSSISRWFGRRRGLMTGIGISGLGLGIGIMPTVASQLIESFDWRTALIIVGSVGLVVAVVLAQLIKPRPAEVLLPDGNGNAGVKTAAGTVVRTRDFSYREAARTPQFWMIFFTWLFYGFFFYVGGVHIVPYATDLGLSALAAASILTIIGILGTFGRASLGLAGDKFSNRVTLAAGFAVVTIAYICLLMSSSVWMLYVFAVLYGCFSGVGILLIPMLAEYFGLNALGTLTGVIIFGNSIGGAISPTLSGYIFDTTGSYSLAFILCAVLGAGSSLIFWLLRRPSLEKVRFKNNDL